MFPRSAETYSQIGSGEFNPGVEVFTVLSVSISSKNKDAGWGRVSCADDGEVFAEAGHLYVPGLASGEDVLGIVPFTVPQHSLCASKLYFEQDGSDAFFSVTYVPYDIHDHDYAEVPTYMDWLTINLWILFALALLVMGFFFSSFFGSKTFLKRNH